MSSMWDAAVRRAGDGGFDKPVAALAGGAAAAMLLLLPVDLLQDLVIESGLASFFPAAEPPLGLKARAAFAVFAALVAFALTFGAMRMIGRGSGPAAPRDEDRDKAEPDMVAYAPRMRRRDLHPDAPVRAPLSALRDLGDPGEVHAPPLAAQPEPEREHEHEPEPEPKPRDERVLLDRPGPPTREDDGPMQTPVELRGANSEPRRHPEPTLPPPTETIVSEPQPQAERRSRLHGEATIGELMARLERALGREDAGAASLGGNEAPLPPEPAEPIDARLRSALENLKRFAPGHG